MSKKPGWREIDAASTQSMTRFNVRNGFEPTSVDMPFARAMDVPIHEVGSPAGAAQNGKSAKDGRRLSFTETIGGQFEEGDDEAGAYEIRERMIGVRLFMRFLKARAITPMDLFRQLAAVGRAIHEPPFCEMTMQEASMMEGQSPAAHSWRCKVMSGEIELAGMKGSKLPGQKSKAASDSYREQRKGNCNRVGGKKAAAKSLRQQSFLRKLKVPPKPKQPHD